MSMTFRTKLRAKSGSMPLEQPAMMLSVPVGAIVIVVAFLKRLFSMSLENAFLEIGKNRPFPQPGPGRLPWIPSG